MTVWNFKSSKKCQLKKFDFWQVKNVKMLIRHMSVFQLSKCEIKYILVLTFDNAKHKNSKQAKKRKIVVYIISCQESVKHVKLTNFDCWQDRLKTSKYIRMERKIFWVVKISNKKFLVLTFDNNNKSMDAKKKQNCYQETVSKCQFCL